MRVTLYLAGDLETDGYQNESKVISAFPAAAFPLEAKAPHNRSVLGSSWFLHASQRKEIRN